MGWHEANIGIHEAPATKQKQCELLSKWLIRQRKLKLLKSKNRQQRKRKEKATGENNEDEMIKRLKLIKNRNETICKYKICPIRSMLEGKEVGKTGEVSNLRAYSDRTSGTYKERVFQEKI